MLHHRSQRFARDPHALALLNDQIRRSQSARVTSATFRSDPESLGEIQHILTRPDFVEKRDAIARDPTCPEAADLLKACKKIVRLCSSKITYSPGERVAHALPSMRAYQDFFGVTNVFFTITPDDGYTTLIGRLVMLPDTRGGGRNLALGPSNSFWNGPVEVSQDADTGAVEAKWGCRVAESARGNAVAVAEISNRMFKCVIAHLFGMHMESDYKLTPTQFTAVECGVFGSPLAAYAINECQARGQLHWHVELHVSLHHWLFQFGANHKKIAQALLSAIGGTQVSTQVDANLHAAELHRKAARKPRVKHAKRCPFVPSAGDGSDAAVKQAAAELRAFGNEVLSSGSGAHEHRNPGTCTHGRTGKHMCRLCYGRSPCNADLSTKDGSDTPFVGLAREIGYTPGPPGDRKYLGFRTYWKRPLAQADSDSGEKKERPFVSPPPVDSTIFELPDGIVMPVAPYDGRFIEYVFPRPIIDPAEFTSDFDVLIEVYFSMLIRRLHAYNEQHNIIDNDACYNDARALLGEAAATKDVDAVKAAVRDDKEMLVQLAQLAMDVPECYKFPWDEETRTAPRAAVLADVPKEHHALFLDALSMKNMLLSETSPVVAALTGASTNAQYLCGTIAACIVNEYMTNYMLKDKQDPHALVAFISSAFKHIHDHPSKAPDAADANSCRLSLHFLQRVINSAGGHIELSIQQCAANALQIPANMGTHRIAYLFHTSARAYRASERRSEQAVTQAVPADDSETDTDLSVAEPRLFAGKRKLRPAWPSRSSKVPQKRKRARSQHTHEAQHCDNSELDTDIDSCDDIGSQDTVSESGANDADPLAAISDAAPKPGFAGVAVRVTTDAGTHEFVISSQHQEYDFRGPDLQDLSLFEWVGVVQREHLKGPPCDEKSAAKARAGRISNARHKFLDDYDGSPFLVQVSVWMCLSPRAVGVGVFLEIQGMAQNTQFAFTDY
jgi:hypothetical protein